MRRLLCPVQIEVLVEQHPLDHQTKEIQEPVLNLHPHLQANHHDRWSPPRLQACPHPPCNSLLFQMKLFRSSSSFRTLSTFTGVGLSAPVGKASAPSPGIKAVGRVDAGLLLVDRPGELGWVPCGWFENFTRFSLSMLYLLKLNFSTRMLNNWPQRSWWNCKIHHLSLLRKYRWKWNWISVSLSRKNINDCWQNHLVILHQDHWSLLCMIMRFLSLKFMLLSSFFNGLLRKCLCLIAPSLHDDGLQRSQAVSC